MIIEALMWAFILTLLAIVWRPVRMAGVIVLAVLTLLGLSWYFTLPDRAARWQHMHCDIKPVGCVPPPIPEWFMPDD